MTLAEWAALPEDNSRFYELIDGVMHIGPKERPWHQVATCNLTALLDHALPDELTALLQVEVVVAEDPRPTVRVPDITVAPNELVEANVPRISATDVSLLVEIVSPHTRETDRVTKFAEYSRAGIPHYWVIEIEDPATLMAYSLAGGRYHVVAEATGPVELSEPAAIAFEVGRLVEPKYPSEMAKGRHGVVG